MPSHSLELKAKICKPHTIDIQLVTAHNLCGMKGACVLDQKDIFFGTSLTGSLLKLRMEDDRVNHKKQNVLVAYEREAKHSKYILVPVDEDSLDALVDALTMTNGLLGEVLKTRHVFIHERNGLQARIHLDRVKGLGEFIEFQVMMQDEFQTPVANEFLHFLAHTFNIPEKNCVSGSYLRLKQGLEQLREEAKQAKKLLAEKISAEQAIGKSNGSGTGGAPGEETSCEIETIHLGDDDPKKGSSSSSKELLFHKDGAKFENGASRKDANANEEDARNGN